MRRALVAALCRAVAKWAICESCSLSNVRTFERENTQAFAQSSGRRVSLLAFLRCDLQHERLEAAS